MKTGALALLHSDALIQEGEFPFRRVLLLALSFAPVARLGTCCEWCSDNDPAGLRVRNYPEVGPRHPKCFAVEFILMGDTQEELNRFDTEQEK